MAGIGERANVGLWVGVDVEIIRRLRANRLNAIQSPIVLLFN